MEQRDEKDLGKLIELLESAFEEVHLLQQRATEALLLLRVSDFIFWLKDHFETYLADYPTLARGHA